MIVKWERQCWVRPNGSWYGGGMRYGGIVAVETNLGWLLLIEEGTDVETGQVVRRPVKASDLPVGDIDWMTDSVTLSGGREPPDASRELSGIPG